MKNESYLKKQLLDFVDVYQRSLMKTSGVTIAFSIFTLVVIGLLLKVSSFDPSSTKKQISLLSYFFTKYSTGETYSLVDLSKTVFLFFASIFSIAMIRLSHKEEEPNEYKLGNFTSGIQVMDILYVTGTLLVCAVLDYLLFQLDTLMTASVTNNALNTWFHNINYYIIRVYLPMMIFSIVIFRITSLKKLKIHLKTIVYLFVSLWIMNEFAYEFMSYVRPYVFNFILVPFQQENKFIYESFLGIILIAFYFVGYYSAMTKSLILLAEDDQ